MAVPLIPLFLAGKSTPTVPHMFSKRKDSGFPHIYIQCTQYIQYIQYIYIYNSVHTYNSGFPHIYIQYIQYIHTLV